MSPLQALLGVGLTIVICATPGLVLWEYSRLSSTVGNFALAQNVTGVLADSQRDTLLTVIALDGLEDETVDVKTVSDQNAYLGQQLHVLESRRLTPASEPKVREALAAQKALSNQLAGLTAIGATAGSDAVVAALPAMRHEADQAQAALYGLYGEYENAFYGELSQQLGAGRSLQVLILGCAVLSLLLGAALSWSLRASVRREFDQAYGLLAREAAERELAQEAVERSERRFRALVQQSTDMTLVLDADHLVTYASPSVEQLLRTLHLKPLGANVVDLVHPSAAALVADAFRRCAAEPGRSIQLDLPLSLDAFRTDGPEAAAAGVGVGVVKPPDHYFVVQLTNLLDDLAIAGIIVNAHDVTDRTRHAAALEHLAYHDRLTGLPNRLSLERDLGTLGDRSPGATVVVLDLDGFRAINERIGEAAGDVLLFDLAARLSRLQGFAAYHLGGDEFALLGAVALDGPAVERLVAQVRHIVDSTADSRHGIPLTAGIGVSLGSLATVHGHELLRHADSMVHQAKLQGADQLVVFNEARTQAAAERGAMVEELSHALERDEFELHFQPIVHASNRSWLAVEALLRWHSPSGFVSPATFIPIAEQTRLIVPIGRWVLAMAAREVARIREITGLPLRVNVNVSASQLQEQDFIDHALAVLAETGLNADALVLELTESAVLEDPDLAISVLSQARAAGMHVALDDFGTGYSSLSYLLRLPVDIVKVDRSFLRDVTTSVRTRQLLHALVDLAHQLDMSVTVEGVETEEENAVVVQAGCDTIQGYLLARPMPVKALIERAVADRTGETAPVFGQLLPQVPQANGSADQGAASRAQ